MCKVVLMGTEISLLVGLSALYNALRLRSSSPSSTSPFIPPRPLSPTNNLNTQSASPARDRFAKSSGTSATHLHPSSREDLKRASSLDDGESYGTGSRGCVWGTEEREYRYVRSSQSSGSIPSPGTAHQG